jgi:TPR repeat protein
MAQFKLGEMYCCNIGGVPQSFQKALYWLRKAGFQRIPYAQTLLASTVVRAKAQLYDGWPNHVGYPEKLRKWRESPMTMMTMNTTFRCSTANVAAPKVPPW